MEICTWNNRMIYVCTHIEPSYTLDCPYEIIDNTKSGLPESYRHLRGMLQVLMKPLPDEIGIFQRRRYLPTTEIPQGYDCVVPKDFPNFNIRQQYGAYHCIADFDLVESIVNEKDFSEYVRTVSDEQYFHNIFILKKDDYIRYCNFLFSVLNEYVNRKGDARDVCFLAERLGSYWIWKNIPKEKRYVVKTITKN